MMKMNRLFTLAILLYVLITSGCDLRNEDINYTSPEGIYTSEENSVVSGYRKYLIELQEVNNLPGTYIISNFHNSGDDEFLYSEMQGDSVFISNQIISDMTVNGSGKISADFSTIRLTYRTDDGIMILDYYVQYSR